MENLKLHTRPAHVAMPDVHRPELAELIHSYERRYGTRANRASCDTGHKAGTFVKHLTCRFMDEHPYSQTGETMSEITGSEITVVGDG